MTGALGLPVIDAFRLEEARRALLRPDETLTDRDGIERRLPRYFFEVDSWQTALHTELAEHFTLSELMGVDVREAQPLRLFPRYVPCTVVVMAAHLELIRQATGTFVHIAANGGYRSPAHRLTSYASPHCWGSAANIYKIGDELLDSPERIEKYRRLVNRILPAAWVRPYGHDKGFADDHLHIDLGYLLLEPRRGSPEPA